jgi:uncharacterized protein
MPQTMFVSPTGKASMTPQERELIQSVFDRLAKVAGSPKDPEAEALIAERLRQLPDGGYNLVQAVVMQEMTLKQAQAHIAELERRLSAAPAAAPGGSFLPGQAANPWGQPARSAIPQVPPQPQYGQPQPYAQPQYAQPQQAAPAWGQAPANAATAAAGVAGGVLLAEGISSLFGGHHGGFGGGFGGGGFGGGSPWGGGTANTEAVTENVTVNNYYGGDQGGPQDDTQDIGYDDPGGDFGGADDVQDV